MWTTASRRAPSDSEVIAVEPGVHGVRVAVGQRTSLEKEGSRAPGGFSEKIYARQTEKGGLPLSARLGAAPAEAPASVDVREGSGRSRGLYLAGAGHHRAGGRDFQGSTARA